MKRVTSTPAVLFGIITRSFLKHLLFLLVMVFISTSYLAAQKPRDDIRVRGTITDKGGTPIEGVSIRVKGKNLGSPSNDKGEFSIGVDPRAVLIVSHLGYKPQEIAVERRNQIEIALEPSVSDLEEVVVVGLWYNP